MMCHLEPKEGREEGKRERLAAHPRHPGTGAQEPLHFFSLFGTYGRWRQEVAEEIGRLGASQSCAPRFNMWWKWCAGPSILGFCVKAFSSFIFRAVVTLFSLLDLVRHPSQGREGREEGTTGCGLIPHSVCCPFFSSLGSLIAIAFRIESDRSQRDSEDWTKVQPRRLQSPDKRSMNWRERERERERGALMM